MIISYSERRAGKDAYNCNKGIKRLEKEYKNGTITKDKINKRIEAHVCICFVAYKVYKELERILKLSDINLSVDSHENFSAGKNIIPNAG